MEQQVDGSVVWHIAYPTEAEIREQLRTRLEGPPVYCFIEGYPPLPGERTHAYQQRVMPLLRAAWQESSKEGERLGRAVVIAWGAAILLVSAFLLVVTLNR